jgi:hypothetical protein
MAYDEALAKRIEKLIAGKKGFIRKEMFGGVGYMYNGNMCVGVHKNDLIIRYDPKLTAEINSDKNVKEFDITGRPMKGWSLVSTEGIKGNALDKWFELAFSFVKTLPQKK